MRRKTNRRKRRSSRIAALLGSIPIGRILIVVVAGLSVVGVAIGGSYALGRLNAHVDGLVLSDKPEATVSLALSRRAAIGRHRDSAFALTSAQIRCMIY